MNLEELHKKLSGHLEQQMKNYSSFVYAQEKGFYQGFEEIGIEGCRPTEKRFERYKIEKYLSKRSNCARHRLKLRIFNYTYCKICA